MNFFRMAKTQLLKERKKTTIDNVIEYATRIRAFADKHPCLVNRIENNKSISPQLRYKYRRQGINL